MMTRQPEPQTQALAVEVRELLRRPGSHKHVVLRRASAGVATPVASVRAGAPVVVDAEVESVVEGLLVTGQVTALARLQCVRCLREVDETMRIDVQELFALDERDAEEEGYALLPDDRLPLDTMVRDAIVLAFPVAPLCQDDCAGLCPTCGTDRNQRDCGHGGAPIDPRWQPLLDALRTREPREQRDDGRPEEEDDARR